MTTGEEPSPRRLAIIGAGSSGLVTLKLAIEALEGWEIVCYERSTEATGSWGNPYEGFVSTSTKYTTQFACHRKFDDYTAPRGVEDGREFFRDDEYGRYLEDFVEEYQLQVHLRTSTRVQKLEKGPAGWRVWTEGKPEEPETFDSVVLCTGLAERPKTIDAPVEVLQSLEVHAPVRDKTVVVIGGGESAVDFANRLAEPSLENRVYLALSRGIRVSPRYHPIRGVPSDFLRTRLLLSIHESIRNAVGQKFVEARIKHQELFERFFRSGRRSLDQARTVRDKKRYWAAKLTERAKDDLFNMFHNKSDDFLDAVGEGRIEIIGGAVDDGYQRYAEFEGGGVLEIAPDCIVPKIGYTSNLEEISDGRIRASDFYLGCVHVEYDDLFLIGFARPIIGSIPPISEVQARYITGLIAGVYERPHAIARLHTIDRQRLEETYPRLDAEEMYPVEMIPYCDDLAGRMEAYPSLGRLRSLRVWLKILLTPASTLHYVNDDFDPDFVERQEVHAPILITALLVIIRLFDIPYRIVRRGQ